MTRARQAPPRAGLRAAAPAVLVALLLAGAFGGLGGLSGRASEHRRLPRTLRAVVQAHVARLPRRGSGGFDAGTERERRIFTEAFTALGDDVDRARLLAGGVGYRVVDASASGRRLLVLAPGPDARRGWGLYVRDPESRNPLTVEVVHPLADTDTVQVGVELFEASRAQNLLIAGAHRDAVANGSADIAHNEASPLEAVHEALVRPGAVFVQPHGFDRPRAVESDAIVSSGRPPAGQAARRVAAALRASGLAVCVYRTASCDVLGATTNVQGRSARTGGAQFVHVELSPDLRTDLRRRARAVTALARALR